jgi:predicted permease
MQNLRLIVRTLAKNPLFTCTAVLSLALGIGANTAMFSMVDRVLLRTLPVTDPQNLVFLYHPGPLQGSSSTDERGGPAFSYPMFRELQKSQTPFVGLAGSRSFSVSLAYGGQASLGSAMLVSGNYLSLLGVGTSLGRILTEEDDRVPSGHPVVALTHEYWTMRFGQDPAVLNSTLVVNGHPMTIVGVLQKRFASDNLTNTPDIYVPIAMKREITPDWDGLNDRLWHWVNLVGRLKPGMTIERATTEINVGYRAQLLEDLAVMSNPEPDFKKRFEAKTIVLREGAYGRGNGREDGITPVLMLMGMTVLVLLIACANIANLQLARATARAREFAVKLAIGASRPQLVRQLLAESCAVAVLGGALGLVVAYWTLRGIQAALPESMASWSVLSTDLDARLLLFSFLLSLAAGVLFGLYPALQASRRGLLDALRDQNGQATATRGAGLFRKTLVTMQAAMSLLLLISAGLFGKTLLNLARVDLGFQPDHLVTFSVLPKLNGYTDGQAAAFYGRLTERLRTIPGVTLVSAARVAAIANSSTTSNVTVEGFTPQSAAEAHTSLNYVGADYFRTLGIPLIAGREFDVSDDSNSPRVAVVNEAFARHFIRTENPLGRRVARGEGNRIKPDITIVGVVKDAKYSNMREEPPRVLYTPYMQLVQQSTLHYYLRTGIDPEHAAPAVRREVAALDPNLPVRGLRTMEQHIADRLARERLLSRLTAVFGALATLLAAIGLHGVLAYNVARRTREIGIRMALGAGAGQVRKLVIRDVSLMLGIGMATGVAAAAGIAKLLESVLFGLTSWDFGVYAGAVATLTIIAVLAAYIPARRATRVDPMVALRYE